MMTHTHSSMLIPILNDYPRCKNTTDTAEQ